MAEPQRRYEAQNSLIAAENVKIRLKGNGGIKIIDELGEENDELKLFEKQRIKEDEKIRPEKNGAVYQYMFVEIIPKAIPVTIETITANNFGGVAETKFINTVEQITEDWQTAIEYILQAINLKLAVGNFEVYSTLLNRWKDAKLDIRISEEGAATENFVLNLVDQRASGNLFYNDLFVKHGSGEGFTSDSGTSSILEKRIELVDESNVLQDIDIDVRLSFYGYQNMLILNG